MALLNAKDQVLGMTPLMVAIQSQAHGTLKVLMDAKVDVSLADNAGRTAQDYALASGDETTMAAFLDDRLITPSRTLQQAFAKNDAKACQQTLNGLTAELQATLLNLPWRRKRSLFYQALADDRCEIVKVLLECRGLDFAKQDEDGNTSVHLSLKLSDISLMETVIERVLSRLKTRLGEHLCTEHVIVASS